MNKIKAFSLAVIVVSVFASMALMDYLVMNKDLMQYPDWIYKYWVAMGILVTAIAVAVSHAAWAAGAKPKVCYALFLTVLLFFAAGWLDIFYYVISTLRGQPYSFQVWHWAYKLGYTSWGWTEQILWAAACTFVTALIWRWALK